MGACSGEDSLWERSDKREGSEVMEEISCSHTGVCDVGRERGCDGRE